MNPDQNSNTPLPSHKTRIYGFAALIIVVVTIAAFIVIHYHHTKLTTTSTPPQATIQVTSTGFIPATLSIKLGTEVVWKNTDTAAHVIASNPYPADNSLPGLHSQALPPQGSYTFTPTSTSTIHYHDNLHPTVNGTIVVSK